VYIYAQKAQFTLGFFVPDDFLVSLMTNCFYLHYRTERQVETTA
jgi:hypothetical protein